MPDTPSYPYSTHLNEYYGPLELVDVPALESACKDRWYNQTLCRVNGSVVRLGIVQGEYHWHKHEQDDEFFYVVDGQLLIDVNLLFKLDENGLRDKVTPLVGLEYTF